MDNAIYVGLSRQMLLQRELDVAANNLANVDTAGFKFEDILAAADPVTPPASGGLASTPVTFVTSNGVARDYHGIVEGARDFPCFRLGELPGQRGGIGIPNRFLVDRARVNLVGEPQEIHRAPARLRFGCKYQSHSVILTSWCESYPLGPRLHG